MAATMLVRDFFFRCSTDLKDIAPQFTRWTMKELVAWTEDGMRAICKYMPHAFAVVKSMKLDPGTKQSIEFVAANRFPDAIERRGVSVQEVYRNMGADGLTPGRAINIVDRGFMDRANANWHKAQGSNVVREYTYDQLVPTIFWVSPPVTASEDNPVWVEAAIVWEPTAIPTAGKTYLHDGNDADLLPINTMYADDLFNYVMARCYLKDSEAQTSKDLFAAHTSLFTTSINAQVKAATGVNPNLKSLPFAPALPVTTN